MVDVVAPSARMLVGLAEIDAGLDVTVFGVPALRAAHPELAAAFELVDAPVAGASRAGRVAVASGGWRDYRLPIPAALAGQRQAAIRLSAPTFMPALRDPASDDLRALSLMISAVRVD